MCESFFATLDCERIDRRTYRTHQEARLDLFQFIEGWYNTHQYGGFRVTCPHLCVHIQS